MENLVLRFPISTFFLLVSLHSSQFAFASDLDDFCVANFRGLGRNTYEFYQIGIPDSRHIPSEVESMTLFGLRDRIVAAGKYVKIQTAEEASIVSAIRKTPVVVGDNISLQQLDEDVLLRAYKRLAYRIAVKKKKLFLDADFDDLLQASMIGLSASIRKYTSNANTKFSIVANQMMTHEVDEVLRLTGTATNRADSEGLFQKTRRYARLGYELRKKLGRSPTAREIARASNIEYSSLHDKTSPENVLEKLEAYRTNMATANELLIEPKTSEAIANSYGPVAVDIVSMLPSEVPLLEEAYAMKQRASVLSAAMFQMLTPKERHALGRFYGIEPKTVKGENWIEEIEPQTFDEIAKETGVSRARVSQLVEVARKKIKKSTLVNADIYDLMRPEPSLFQGVPKDPNLIKPEDRRLDYLGF